MIMMAGALAPVTRPGLRSGRAEVPAIKNTVPTETAADSDRAESDPAGRVRNRVAVDQRE